MRAWISGRLAAFQAAGMGSIPIARKSKARLAKLVNATDLKSVSRTRLSVQVR